MKRICTFALLLLFAACCFADSARELDAYLEKAAAAYHIPGMSFFITDADGCLFEKTSGQCTDKRQKFFIGSESKSFTALCILQLAEQGLLQLDDEISRYLPGLSLAKPVTVKMLLNQNSGFDTHMKLMNARVTDSYGRYEYANVNYDLLGKIVEAVSGMSYKDYIREQVFLPLGMQDSAADAESVRGDQKLLLGNRNFFGFFVRGDADYPGSDSWFHEPAGFISTTPADFQKYLRMYLHGGLAEDGSRIISELGIQRMCYDSIFQHDGSVEKYGMGWNSGEFAGEKVLFHGGQVENYISFMCIIPAKRQAFAFNINGNDQFGMNSLMNDVALGVVRILNGEEPPEAKASSYLMLHGILDVAYLLVLLISLCILKKSIRPRTKMAGKAKRMLWIVLAYAAWPLFLLCIIPIALRTPLWVVRHYVPDLFLVLVAGMLLPLLGAACAAARRLGMACSPVTAPSS